MTRHLTNGVDYLNELLYPYITRTPLPSRLGSHTVLELPLLQQIHQTVTGSTTGGEVFSSSYASKPAGRLDCLDWWARIEGQSALVCKDLNLEVPRRLRPRLQAIARVLPPKPNRLILGWWTSAKVLTQHETPPLALRAPCPEEDCEGLGTLRVRFDPNVALCTHCGASWSDNDPAAPEAFNELAHWVQWSVEHLLGPAHRLKDGSVCQECATERTQRAQRRAVRLQAERASRLA